MGALSFRELVNPTLTIATASGLDVARVLVVLSYAYQLVSITGKYGAMVVRNGAVRVVE